MTPHISLSFGLGPARNWNSLSLCLFVTPENTGRFTVVDESYGAFLPFNRCSYKNTEDGFVENL